MGDVGSILLGFVFAGMVVFLSGNLLDFICMAGFLFPFYADELNTMIVRLRDGENLTKPHRRHLYQLLANEYGIAHWKVSLGYGLFQLIVGISIRKNVQFLECAQLPARRRERRIGAKAPLSSEVFSELMCGRNRLK